jgi:hypothetical protein
MDFEGNLITPYDSFLVKITNCILRSQELCLMKEEMQEVYNKLRALECSVGFSRRYKSPPNPPEKGQSKKISNL